VPIPKVAHFIWIGPPPSPWLQGLRDTFVEHHPDWEIRDWGDAEIAALDLVNADTYAACDRIVPPDSAPQMRSDIARYEILHRFGGLYSDYDYRWQKPADGLLEGHDAIAGWESQNQFIATGLIAAAPGHPALAAAIAGIPARVANRNPSWRSNRLTGPHLWTPVALEHGVHVFDQDVFHPVAWDEPLRADAPFPDSVAVHQWAHQRLIRGLPS
jgi:mannosyltransferase OCH1-like enzyme